MSKSNTGPPKCMVCGFNHWLRDPHKWPDTDTAHIRGAKEFKPKKIVATLKKKVATITDKPTGAATSDNNVATIRQVSIRELNNNISKHFSNLPFEVTKNGKVIARVEKAKK